MKFSRFFPVLFGAVFFLSVMSASLNAAEILPPSNPVKLLFIHHSTGGNWLADSNPDQPSGGLGRALMNSNYYVSATNYGWGPYAIGDRTDIPDWPAWFTGDQSHEILSSMYLENGQNTGDFGGWPRLETDPSGENEIIMFKSCFPNSDLFGNPDDPAAALPGDQYTVSNAKAVYNNILQYFATRQDKLFIIITSPPQNEVEYSDDYQSPAHRAANARAFATWLLNGWLSGYPYNNVAVFDYFNVLTGENNHHRLSNNLPEHIVAGDNNFAAYPEGPWDSHPNSAGQEKATSEFVPLLNFFYSRWKEGGSQESLRPVCRVMVNGSDNPEALSEDENIRISLSIAPGDFKNSPSDIFLIAVEPEGGMQSFNLGTLAFENGLTPVYSGPLIALSGLYITTLTDLQRGEYVFYFGVDTRMNGLLDMDLLSYHAVSVSVK